MAECERYEKDCIAPLCPESPDLDRCHWFADEPVCTARNYATVDWIQKQRKVAALRPRPEGFFTVAMLQALGRIGKGLRGADPDTEDSEQHWMEGRARRKKSYALV